MANTSIGPRPPHSSKPVSRSSRIPPPSSALKAIGAQPRINIRRPTKQASYELCNHAKAYLEGGKFASGYDFLYSLLAAGTSISKPETPYLGFLAPPAYIAFASSLVAYPKLTTKTNSRDAQKGPDAALRYLRCIHNTIDGPAYPTIRKALSFPKESNRRRAPGHRSGASSRSPELGGDIESIAGDAANSQSLWAQAEDFWHVVGWAFNCSVAHKKRWSRWKLWLEMTIDFLERDWDFCEAKHKEDGPERQSTLEESLLWHYVVGNSGSTNRGARRRIVKAVFAAATVESIRDYPEVWDKETAGPPRSKNKSDDKRLADVDFETGNTGDYDSDDHVPNDSSEEEDFLTIEGDTILNTDDATSAMGGIDAVHLRQRLVALLATVASHLPAQFTTVSDLFDNILEDFNQMPIMVFRLLLTTSSMTKRYHVAFVTNLLLPMISSKVPDYFNHEPEQGQFETMLLPLRAVTQSFAANAKLSLILEQVMLYMCDRNTLVASESLHQAVEAGINARHAVLGTGRGKKGNAQEEEQSKAVMHACSGRMLCLLELLEMAAGKQPTVIEPTSKQLPASLSFMSGSSLSSAPDSEMEDET